MEPLYLFSSFLQPIREVTSALNRSPVSIRQLFSAGCGSGNDNAHDYRCWEDTSEVYLGQILITGISVSLQFEVAEKAKLKLTSLLPNTRTERMNIAGSVTNCSSSGNLGA